MGTILRKGLLFVGVVVLTFLQSPAAGFPQLTPEILLPIARSSAIWVFELNN